MKRIGLLFLLSLFGLLTACSDVLLPQAVDVAPQGDGVPVDAVVTATFSNPLPDPTSIGEPPLRVRSSGGDDVDGSISYDADTGTLSFQPAQALDHDATYVASLHAAPLTPAGVYLASDESWEFTTVAAAENEEPSETTEPTEPSEPDVLDPDGDEDGDGVPNGEDNCPDAWNAGQDDLDGDGFGDACDDDLDGDGLPNDEDPDRDGDGLENDEDPDANDPDVDGDGTVDGVDNCPETANEGQADLDQDGVGDACDGDIDGDGVPNEVDPEPMDDDRDGDGVIDGEDNCPDLDNPDQTDADDDGAGTACDPDDAEAGVAPTIASFSADPAVVTDPSGTVLRWDVEDGGEGLTLSLDHGIGVVDGTSYEVLPFTTKTYTLTASNAYGADVQTVTVEVDLPSDADFSGRDLSGYDFTGAVLDGMNFDGAILDGADFEHASAVGTSFVGASLDGAKLKDGNFTGADFTEASIRDVNANRGDFTEADFTRATLDESNFVSTTLADAHWEDTSTEDTNFELATW